ncbi:hypothetical protein [Dehalococcoides mccartyi]|uniref:Uncharacterized protein n=1 Tax=Dehalococcoides mccartyi (strain CBDB1) TaxID=255470 RepID=A0A916KM85_DEHMC|nr:hypothetical protein [Dehalococcoides mccartyi]CAI82865.1 hypothetical protein cbdbA703 [Dehalococcoides mccartyi CBDB1]
MDKIGVPTVNGMKSAFGSYLWGAGGGLLYNISRSIFGSGLLGSLVAPVLAGSVIKGETGKQLALTAGFVSFSGLGSAQVQEAQSDNSSAGVM